MESQNNPGNFEFPPTVLRNGRRHFYMKFSVEMKIFYRSISDIFLCLVGLGNFGCVVCGRLLARDGTCWNSV